MNLGFNNTSGLPLLLATLLLAFGLTGSTLAQSTAFTYQGRLQDGGTNANGTYDFQFTLWDSLSGGNQQPQPSPVTVTRPGVAVANGVFTVQLDFGVGAFPGADRFLETSVRPAGGGAFTLLSPRQPITSTPYSIRSATSASSDVAMNATQLAGVAASQYVQTNDSRLSDARAPSAGSPNYIQNNPASAQAGNFNISGDGTASGKLSGNIVNAASEFDLNGDRMISNSGSFNTFVGSGTGRVNTTGNTNSFFGSDAGYSNTTGAANSFFGKFVGFSNTTGDGNSFFGSDAGTDNTDGSYNSFFGYLAGIANTHGGVNAFFGALTGKSNTTGLANSFFGNQAGSSNTMGHFNSFFGNLAGVTNTTGTYNNAIGHSADVGTNLNNATAIGALAQVTQNNSLVLGSISGVNGATADTNVGIGTTAPTARLHVVGTTGLIGNVGIGTTAPAAKFQVKDDTPVSDLLRLSTNSFLLKVNKDGRVGINTTDATIPRAMLDVTGFQPINAAYFDGTVVLAQLGAVGNGNFLCRNSLSQISDCFAMKVTQDGLVGMGATQAQNLRARLDVSASGAPSGIAAYFDGSVVLAPQSGGNVGIGTATPTFKLHVNGETRTNILSIDNFVSNSGGPSLCASTSTNRVGLCSSSLRYKEAVQTFRHGLDIVNRLRPISFSWKESGMHDIGLAAEEVDKISPLLTFRNDKGEIEGVKYNQLSAIFINAFKEQQAQIEQQQKQLKQQQEQIERERAANASQQQQLKALKDLVCRTHRRASVCKQ